MLTIAKVVYVITHIMCGGQYIGLRQIVRNLFRCYCVKYYYIYYIILYYIYYYIIIFDIITPE